LSLPAWLPVLLAVPVLLLGERLNRRVPALARFNIPAPVTGGLLVSLALLLAGLAMSAPLQMASKVTARWWTWLVTIEPEWMDAPARSVTMPMLVAFFTCIGLNASREVLRRGGSQVLLFLLLGTGLAVLQNVVGVVLATLLGADPLLGLVSGSISMTGGHGTALGFAPVLEQQGLAGAGALGAAAATMGLVAGGLLGGPIGIWMVRRHRLRAIAAAGVQPEAGAAGEAGILRDLVSLGSGGWTALWHLLLVLACVKAGAWVSHFMELTGIRFPPHIGAMVVGVAVRNALDAAGWRRIRGETVDLIASVMLAFFLTVAMMSLNLMEVGGAAVPMLVILVAQVALMGVFAAAVTYRLMGRDYDAAVMAAGHCGFGLGATPNAVANMKSLVDRLGPAPRAFLVLPLVGAVLIDFANALNVTLFLNLLR
jgi:ESS family glutamate:Na+ symporter